MSTVRFSIRSIRRQPFISAAIVVTRALAVAGNAALFSVFDGMVCRPLPFVEADRIVHLAAPPSRFLTLPPAEVLRLEEKLMSSPLLTDRVRVRFGEFLRDAFDESNSGFVEWGLNPAYVSPGFSSSLGLLPILGRSFVEADAASRPRPALIGYDLWRSRFGADPRIIGKVVDIPGTISRDRWVVVGLMPPGVDFQRRQLLGPAQLGIQVISKDSQHSRDSHLTSQSMTFGVVGPV